MHYKKPQTTWSWLKIRTDSNQSCLENILCTYGVDIKNVITSIILMPFNIPKVVTVMYNGITSNFQLFPSPVQNNRTINFGLDYDTVRVFSIESVTVLKYKRIGRQLKKCFLWCCLLQYAVQMGSSFFLLSRCVNCFVLQFAGLICWRNRWTSSQDMTHYIIRTINSCRV